MWKCKSCGAEVHGVVIKKLLLEIMGITSKCGYEK